MDAYVFYALYFSNVHHKKILKGDLNDTLDL